MILKHVEVNANLLSEGGPGKGAKKETHDPKNIVNSNAKVQL